MYQSKKLDSCQMHFTLIVLLTYSDHNIVTTVW